MSYRVFEDAIYGPSDFTDQQLPAGEYDNCTFKNIDFANGNFSEIRFNDCRFFDCNLSLIKLGQTAFRNILFNNCKKIGRAHV